MVKKIFDILPPEEAEEPEIIKRKEVPVPVKIVQKEASLTEIISPSLKGLSFNFGSMLLVIGLLSLGIFCFYKYFNFAKAIIEIYPEAKLESFQTEMIIDEGESGRSSSSIPGKIYTAEKTISKEFTASGTTIKESKAEGVIRVYNAYSTSPQTLVINTRFISTEGKLFRLKNRIIVPGGHYEGGEFVTGFIDAEVRADQPGEEFNIKTSTFSIPGFAGTAQYTYFYGKSFQPMSGGLKREIAQITQKDLDAAKETLEQQAMNECLSGLKEQIASQPDLVLLEKTAQFKILESFSSLDAGKEAERFTFTIKAKSSVLIFKAEDEKNFINDFISSQIPLEKKIYQKSLSVERSVNEIDLDSGKIILSLAVRAKIYSGIDEISLKKALKGKSLSESQFYLENYPQLIKSSITLWPFWVKKVPQNEAKIRVELMLD